MEPVNIGDFVLVSGGYDDFDVLVIDKKSDNLIKVDEIFTRNLHDRVRWIEHWEVIEDEFQMIIYNKLMSKDYGEEYVKYFRLKKLIKINNKIKWE